MSQRRNKLPDPDPVRILTGAVTRYTIKIAALALALAACGSTSTSTSTAPASEPPSTVQAPASQPAAPPSVSASNGSAGWIDSSNVYHRGEPPVSGLNSGADVAAVQVTFTNDGGTTVTVTGYDVGFLGRNGNVISTETIEVGSVPLGTENPTLNPGRAFTDTEGLVDGGPWATAGDRAVATGNITVSDIQWN